MRTAGNGKSRRHRRSTCRSPGPPCRAAILRRRSGRVMRPPNPPRTPYGRTFAWLFGLVAAALAAFWGWRRLGPRLCAWRQARRQLWQASERASFARLKRACLAGDAAAAYRELGIWARCEGLKTAQVLYEGEPALRCELARLERLLYGGTPAPWNGPALFHAAATVRAARLAADRRGSHAALPALNPYDRATAAATRAAGSVRCFSPPTNAPFYGRR
jgi:hypothetical protein